MRNRIRKEKYKGKKTQNLVTQPSKPQPSSNPSLPRTAHARGPNSTVLARASHSSSRGPSHSLSPRGQQTNQPSSPRPRLSPAPPDNWAPRVSRLSHARARVALAEHPGPPVGIVFSTFLHPRARLALLAGPPQPRLPRCAVDRPASQAYRPASPERTPLPEDSPTELGDHAELLLDPLSPHGTKSRPQSSPALPSNARTPRTPAASFIWRSSPLGALTTPRQSRQQAPEPPPPRHCWHGALRHRGPAAPPRHNPGELLKSLRPGVRSFSDPSFSDPDPCNDLFVCSVDLRRRSSTPTTLRVTPTRFKPSVRTYTSSHFSWR